LAFKIVVSDKAVSYQMEAEDAKQIVNLSIGDEFDGNVIGLEGYTLKITGGSDKNGFPMRRDISGPRRVRSLLTGGVGYNPKVDGVKRRKTLRGRVISEDIVQINTIVTKAGSKSIADILNPEGEEEAEE
jgi:small subunit ribosomal protein S6e